MSNRLNRYRTMYENLTRPNSASYYPKHVFIRAANLHSNVYDRVGNRTEIMKTTMLHLTERFEGKEVILLGTCNQSTMLAQRTRKVIEDLQPDTVMVQTSPHWWKDA